MSRQEFLPDCYSTKEAFEKCPWGSVAIPVEGGFRVFECLRDYQTWKVQK